MSVPMLVISGAMGSGKTTVLSELSDLLEDAGVAHAAVDLDTLSLMHPRRGEQGERLMYDNLAAMWPNFAALGAERLVVACALEDKADLKYYREAVPGAEPIVCLLVAPVETMQQRVRSRDIGMLQEQLMANSLRLAETLPKARAEDFTVENGDGRSITEVAREILARSGWL